MLTVQVAASTRQLTTAEHLFDETGDTRYLEDITQTERWIDQASAAIEAWCGRIFAQQTYVQTDFFPECTGIAALQMDPLVSVASVVLDGESITDYAILSALPGQLLRRGGWWFSDRRLITATAGFLLPGQVTPPEPTGPTLPDDLERACIESVKVWLFEKDPAQRIQSRTLGDQRIDYGIQTTRRAIPALAQDLLMPWRRWVLR